MNKIKKSKTKKTSKDKKAKPVKINVPSVEDLEKAGVHFGHKTSKRHPKMEEYIASTKDTIHILDLEKSRDKLKKALKFLKKISSDNGLILFVGTKPTGKKIVEEIAKSCSMPYVTERWLGGTLTNFESISARIRHFQNLRKSKKEREWEKYTKKERVKLDRELEKMEFRFGGLENLRRLPDAIFLSSVNDNKTVIREANRKNIPIVAIVDTNSNPENIDYPIPANDDALSSVRLIAEYIAKVVNK